MSDEDFIVELFCSIDEVMKGEKKHVQAKLYPSEVVTLAILFALKGVGNRAFYRWLKKNLKPLFPKLPHRTRLFRLFVTHEDWSKRFLAEPSLLGVADSYGIELLHTWREGRSDQRCLNVTKKEYHLKNYQVVVKTFLKKVCGILVVRPVCKMPTLFLDLKYQLSLATR